MTYQQVLTLIQTALTGRAAGTKVQVAAHETAEKAILDFADQSRSRNAHGSCVANTDCVLTWNSAFSNTNYSFCVDGYDNEGNPCQITLISKTSSGITVQTFTNATLYAIANAY